MTTPDIANLEVPKTENRSKAPEVKKEINPHKNLLDQKFQSDEKINQAFLDLSKTENETALKTYITENFNKKEETDLVLQQLKTASPGTSEYVRCLGYMREDIGVYTPTTKTETKESINQTKKFFEIKKSLEKINANSKFDKATKKAECEKVIQENDVFLKSFFQSQEGQKILNGTRKKVDRDNAYILQIFGNVVLDKNITIDGIYGTQTTEIVRFIQTEGIGGGKKLSLVLSASEKLAVEGYKKAYEAAKAVVTSIVTTTTESVQEENINLENKVTGQQLMQNASIGEYVLNSKDNLSAESFGFTPEMVKKFVSKEEAQTIVDQSINEVIKKEGRQDQYKKCFDENGKKKSDAPTLRHLDEIENKINAKLENVYNQKKIHIVNESNMVIKKEAVAGCINAFEKYFTATATGENFVKSFENIDLQKDVVLESDGILQITGKINESPIVFRYDLATGEIMVNEFLHKNNEKGFTVPDIQCKEKLPFILPKLHDMIVQGQELIINSDILKNANALETYTADLTKSIQEKNNQTPRDSRGERVIAKTMQKNHAMNEMFSIMGDEYKTEIKSTENSLSNYKLFDMIYYTLNQYDASEIKKIRELNKIFKEKVVDVYQSGGEIPDNSEKEFGLTAFSQEKLKADKTNLKTPGYMNSYCAFFTQMVGESKDSTNPKYNVIDLRKYEKVLQNFSVVGETSLLKTDSLKESVSQNQVAEDLDALEQKINDLA